MKKPLELWATCLRLGTLPFPGILGSLCGLVLAVAFRTVLSDWETFVVALALTLVSWLVLGRFARELFAHDPHQVVIDECCGFMLVAAFLSGWWLLAALVLFRVLDNAKPFPARRLERLPNQAAAVFADDLAMAFYTGVVIAVITAFL